MTLVQPLDYVVEEIVHAVISHVELELVTDMFDTI